MFEEIRANRRRAAMLVGAMALLLIAVGYALAEYASPGAGLFGAALAVVIWGVHTLVSYFFGDRVLLAWSGARQIEKKDHPVLFNIVEEMAVASGLATPPKIYIIDDEALNAFATGRDAKHAVVAVTSGMLKALDRDELQGVIAHEISHVNNRDVLYMTMLGVMMGTIIFLAELWRYGGRGITRTGASRGRKSGGGAGVIILIVAILLMILAPILAQMIYYAVSRKREYLADASAAQYTRFPEGLARALEKLGGSTKQLRAATPALVPMFIVNPLKVTARGLSDLSSTHPPISERIRILRSMGGNAGLKSYNEAFRKVTGRAVGVVPFAAVSQSRDVDTKLAATTPSPGSPLEHVLRVRQTTDLLWSLQDYIFLACACGTKLKIPPAYAGKRIECPHCGKEHLAERTN